MRYKILDMRDGTTEVGSYLISYILYLISYLLYLMSFPQFID